MTPEQAARRLERFANDLPRAAERAVGELARRAYGRALWWSAGPLSSATLRKMGHPYARRAPQPNVDPGRINIQTGALHSAWVVGPTQRTGGKVMAAVYNTDPKAAKMAGTALMVKRPLPERVVGELEPKADSVVERVLAAII